MTPCRNRARSRPGRCSAARSGRCYLADLLIATERQARRVLSAEGVWSTYDAGIAFQSLAMEAMSVTDQDGFIPALPTALYQVLGALTDEIDAPGRGSSGQDAEAVQRMRRAASEWINALPSEDSRMTYLDRWVYEECGYDRPGPGDL